MVYIKIALLCLLITPTFADLSIKQMEEMVEKIKAKRVGSKENGKSKSKSPFVLVVKEANVTVIREPKNDVIAFQLGGIVNDAAYINGKWIKADGEISGYKLEKIEKDNVVLRRDQRTIRVFFKKQKNILQVNGE